MIWTIGNGESRKQIDVNSLQGTKIGCNAVYRDSSVDHLICVDRRMLNEALQSEYNHTSKIYTRKDWFRKQKNVRLVPDLPYAGMDRWDDPWHWGAGPYAVLLAATKHKEVKLIGFDLYGIEGKVNNVYKDTNNYSASSKRQVDPRYWIYQIGKVFNCFSESQFTIYQEADWQLPKAWKQPHVKVDKISNIYYNT